MQSLSSHHSHISQLYSTSTCTLFIPSNVYSCNTAVLVRYSSYTAVDYIHAEKLLDVLHYFIIYSTFILYSHSHRCPSRALEQSTIKQTDVIVLQCVYRITSLREATYESRRLSDHLSSNFQHSQISISNVWILSTILESI